MSPKNISSWERCMAVQEPQQPSRRSFRVANDRPGPPRRPTVRHAVRALRREWMALGCCWCTYMIHISNRLAQGTPTTHGMLTRHVSGHTITDDTPYCSMDAPTIRANAQTRGALGAPPTRTRHAYHACYRSARCDGPEGGQGVGTICPAISPSDQRSSRLRCPGRQPAR